MNEALGNSIINLVYRHSIQTCIPAILCIVFVGYLLSIDGDVYGWLIWLMCSVSLYALRPLVVHIISDLKVFTIRGKLVGTAVYNVLLGATIGASVLFFQYLDTVQCLLITVVVMMFVAGGNATNGGYIRILACFLMPLLTPIAIYWMISSEAHTHPELVFTLGALIFVFMGMLLVLAHDTVQTLTVYAELSEKEAAMKTELALALSAAEAEKRKAERSSTAKTRFLASASHDLRQPVHVVSLYGAVLETIPKSKKATTVVKDLNAAITSLSEQLNSLLDLSTLDAGVIKPTITKLNLRKLLNGICQELQNEANTNGIQLKVSINNNIFVLTNKIMFLQIMRNIVGNAIKYTKKGTILLYARQGIEHVDVCCKDSGIGISVTDQQHIFEEFYQADNPGRDRGKGLGLGLSIVERLATCLSHKLSIESQEGVGTTVSLRLEREQKEEHSEDSMQWYSDEQENMASDTLSLLQQNVWVHIVDDEQTVRHSMIMLLKELGCRTSSTSCTVETISHMKKNQPDIVFIDLRLQSGDSGLDTLEAVRKLHPDIRCVMITGESSDNLEELRDDSSLQILRKPVSKNDIVQLLHRHHDKRTAIPGQS